MRVLAAWERLSRIESSRSFGALTLVIFNLVPLAGVLLLGWNVYFILLVYWIENGIVGVINVLKIMMAQGPPKVTGVPLPSSGGSMPQKLSLIPFFILHYGIFWVVHGVFVFSLPSFMGRADAHITVAPIDLVIAVAGLALSHLASFWFTFRNGGEYLRISPQKQVMQPYSRVVVLHVVILVGGALIAGAGQPALLIALLVVLKTAIDLSLYLRTHRSASRTWRPRSARL